MNEAPAAARLTPLRFDALPGWREDDHGAAFRAFRRGAAVLAEHPVKRRTIAIDPAALEAALIQAAALPADLAGTDARAFFEACFDPVEVVPEGGAFFTGYYEPVVAGSRVRSRQFSVPLYRPPADLVEIDPERPPPGIEPGFRFARRTGGGFAPYADRGAIAAGLLEGQGLELCFLADPVDAFFIHIQGAARIRLAEGGTMRVTYAAKTGHPYTPIGRVLIERGALTRDQATMAGIRGWLAAHPAEAGAVMAQNRSFIFFREAAVDDEGLGPIAAVKVPLSAGRSLAVDRLLHSFHMPVFIATKLPDGSDFHHLMIAQDTGSAIVGPARGDIFFGSLAGGMRAGGRFIMLVPKARGP